MKIKLIANPVAGRQALLKIRNAENCLRQCGADVDLTLTRARGDARAAAADARRNGFDRVVAAGGDGTLNEVINGLAPSPIPLAFLPLGTVNVFALEAGIPFAVEAACRIALEGDVRPICLGWAGDTRFLLMAGIGFDAEVVYGINLRLKRLAGKLAYLAGGFTAFWRRTAAAGRSGDGGRSHLPRLYHHYRQWPFVRRGLFPDPAGLSRCRPAGPLPAAAARALLSAALCRNGNRRPRARLSRRDLPART